MIRLVQLKHSENGRKVALVEEPALILLEGVGSIYELASMAVKSGKSLESLATAQRSTKVIDYDPVYNGNSEWTLLPCFDHPDDPNHCLLSGTGLTHKASAENRQKMHDAADQGSLTDSMKMYQIGVDGGKPSVGTIGAQPEWFYKGNGSILRAHNQPLEVPPFGEDGGEEPEVAGIYICGADGEPFRVGFATSNEFSDHVMEKRNYLYLAPSKIRNCSIGPELVVGMDFGNIMGTVQVLRSDQVLWTQEIKSGEENIVHSLANMEYHHFKYSNHRLPGMAHIHFFGADAFRVGVGMKLQHNDIMEVNWEGMGRPLKNPVYHSGDVAKYFSIKAL